MITITLLAEIISSVCLIISLGQIIFQFFKMKKEYNGLKIKMSTLRNINKDSLAFIENIKNNNLTEDDVKMALYLYCYKIIDALNEFYPRYDFSISIKKLTDETVSTIITTGEELFINKQTQLVRDNVEYTSIIDEGFDYFFVTDLHTFNEKQQKYVTSDDEWKYKYNTAIVFPVKTQINYKPQIIGFICVNSPQKLQKRKDNDLIINFLKQTSSNISCIIGHN